MRGVPPALWRTARIVRVLGYIALAIIVVFVASAIYYAAHARPQLNPGDDTASLIPANSTVELTLGLNLSNPGAYPITGPIPALLNTSST